MNDSGKKPVYIPLTERTDKPISLFFLYCAGNIGILGLVYGGIVVGFHLSFLQAALVTVLGALSFVLVGLMSLAGKDTGAITFVLSRAPFGFRGNIIPAVAALIGHVGWLSINVCTGALTVLSLLLTLGLVSSPGLLAISLGLFIALVLISVLLSHSALIKLQTIFTYLFGILTLIVLAFLLPQTNWHALFSMPEGGWLDSFLPALAFVMAGTGIGWTSYASDYSCHQNPQNSSVSVAFAVTLGGALPLTVMIGVGILLSTTVPDLANSPNPIQVIQGALPAGLAAIYYLTAIGGLTPQCFLGLKSSKLLLDAVDISLKNYVVVIFQALIITVIPILILFVAQDFQGTLEGFLGVIGKLLAAWSSIFLVDYWLLRRSGGYAESLLTDPSANAINFKGVVSWIVGFLTGMLFSKTFFFTGPFAVGIFEANSLNVLLTLTVSGGLYWILLCFGKKTKLAKGK